MVAADCKGMKSTVNLVLLEWHLRVAYSGLKLRAMIEMIGHIKIKKMAVYFT